MVEKLKLSFTSNIIKHKSTRLCLEYGRSTRCHEGGYIMTNIQQKYYEYLESKRHNQEMERLTGEQQEEIKRSNRAQEAIGQYQAQTARLTQQTGAKVADAGIQKTFSEIKQIENNIKNRNLEVKLANDQFNWKQACDRFDQGIKSADQLLNNKKYILDSDKFQQSVNQYQKDYELARGNYELAKKKFKQDKLTQNWQNVLKTAETLSKIVSGAKKDRLSLLKGAAAAAKAVAK